MSATYVTVTIRNPAMPERLWQELFLIDARTIDSLVPRDQLEAIGLRPVGHRSYELDDGTESIMDITTGQIEFMGEMVGGTIIMGAPGTKPILGVTALASVGIDADPRNQTLKRLPAVRLKKLAARYRGDQKI